MKPTFQRIQPAEPNSGAVAKAHILGLLLLNLCAHFIPFERAGHQPDDYFNIAFARGFRLAHSAVDFESLDRPVYKALTLFTARQVGLDAVYQALLVLAGSSLLLVAAYLLLVELLDDGRAALAAASLYCLLPNKLEMYGTLMPGLYNLVLSLYVVSAYLYFRFVRSGRTPLLLASVAAYAAAVFCHEICFFLPVALLALGRRRGSTWRSLRWFALPAAAYGALRLSAMTGAIEDVVSRPVQWDSVATNVIYAVPSHFVGRYVARASLYGIAGFLEFSWPWMAFVMVLDLGLVPLLYGFFTAPAAFPRKPKVESALVAAAALIAPACLDSVQGRHTALSSIPLCALAVGLPARIGPVGRAALPAVLLIVSQGDGWHNVVAGRIGRAVLSSLEVHAPELRRADRVVVDCRSFADQIPYTWGERERNVLHYYYGVPMFGAWGLEAMVALVAGESRPLFACSSRPELRGAQLICGEHFAPPGPPRTHQIPRAGTFTLEFSLVYPRGFDPRNGLP